MRDAVTTLLGWSMGFVVTIAALLVFTAWDFAWIELLIAVILVMGAGVGWWARGAWDG